MWIPGSRRDSHQGPLKAARQRHLVHLWVLRKQGGSVVEGGTVSVYMGSILLEEDLDKSTHAIRHPTRPIANRIEYHTRPAIANESLRKSRLAGRSSSTVMVFGTWWAVSRTQTTANNRPGSCLSTRVFRACILLRLR